MGMNILLCCSVGMSTSLLVSRMEKAAKEQGKEYNIWSAPCDAVRYHLKKADVVLLGPQIRYLLPELKSVGDKKGIPVGVISMTDFGSYNGAAVLKLADQMVESYTQIIEEG